MYDNGMILTFKTGGDPGFTVCLNTPVLVS